MSERHKDGKEYLDPTPTEVRVPFRRPQSIHEMIRSYVRSEAFKAKMEAQGFDTEEEANDFDVEEDDDPGERFMTQHELSALAGEEYLELHGRAEFDKMREALKGGASNGSLEGKPGVAGVGPVGAEAEKPSKSESGAVTGSGKEAAGAVKSSGGAGG